MQQINRSILCLIVALATLAFLIDTCTPNNTTITTEYYEINTRNNCKRCAIEIDTKFIITNNIQHNIAAIKGVSSVKSSKYSAIVFTAELFDKEVIAKEIKFILDN